METLRIMPPIKVPAKSKYITIEFLIDPSDKDEYVTADIFETVIIPVGVYQNIYNQLLRMEKLKVLSGARPNKITPRDFYTALKNRHQNYDKAIGYHTFF